MEWKNDSKGKAKDAETREGRAHYGQLDQMSLGWEDPGGLRG